MKSNFLIESTQRNKFKKLKSNNEQDYESNSFNQNVNNSVDNQSAIKIINQIENAQIPDFNQKLPKIYNPSADQKYLPSISTDQSSQLIDFTQIFPQSSISRKKLSVDNPNILKDLVKDKPYIINRKHLKKNQSVSSINTIQSMDEKYLKQRGSKSDLLNQINLESTLPESVNQPEYTLNSMTDSQIIPDLDQTQQNTIIINNHVEYPKNEWQFNQVRLDFPIMRSQKLFTNNDYTQLNINKLIKDNIIDDQNSFNEKDQRLIFIIYHKKQSQKLIAKGMTNLKVEQILIPVYQEIIEQKQVHVDFTKWLRLIKQQMLLCPQEGNHAFHYNGLAIKSFLDINPTEKIIFLSDENILHFWIHIQQSHVIPVDDKFIKNIFLDLSQSSTKEELYSHIASFKQFKLFVEQTKLISKIQPLQLDQLQKNITSSSVNFGQTGGQNSQEVNANLDDDILRKTFAVMNVGEKAQYVEKLQVYIDQMQTPGNIVKLNSPKNQIQKNKLQLDILNNALSQSLVPTFELNLPQLSERTKINTNQLIDLHSHYQSLILLNLQQLQKEQTDKQQNITDRILSKQLHSVNNHQKSPNLKINQNALKKKFSDVKMKLLMQSLPLIIMKQNFDQKKFNLDSGFNDETPVTFEKFLELNFNGQYNLNT